MDFDLINKKLSQAQICLSEMYAQERRAFDSTNSFERHHDGFLSACATVRGLFHERGGGPRDKAIKDWKSAWVKNLTGKETALYDYMQDDRNETQHAGRSMRLVKAKELKIGSRCAQWSRADDGTDAIHCC